MNKVTYSLILAAGILGMAACNADRTMGIGREPGWETTALGYEDVNDRIWYTRDPAVIREVELKLQAAGLDPGPVDGIVNEQFRKGLAAFETQRNLDQDGFVDYETFRALGMADPFVAPGVGIR